MTIPAPTVVIAITEAETYSSRVESEEHRYEILVGVRIPTATRSQ